MKEQTHDTRRAEPFSLVPNAWDPNAAAALGWSQGGFSILEVLVAITIVTVAVAALAQLSALSTRANSSARATTYASVLAQQKMEQLRGLTWGFDVLGLPTTDTTTNLAVVPETADRRQGAQPVPGAFTRHQYRGLLRLRR